MKKRNCLLILLLFFLNGYGQTDSVKTNIDTIQKQRADSFYIVGKAITGIGVAYTIKSNGSKTANREIFSNKAYTAAFNKYKLNSWIKVTNLKNKQYVLLRINDRISKTKSSPLVKISRAAASKLGVLKTKNNKLKVEQIVIIDSNSIERNKLDTILAVREEKLVIDKCTSDSFLTTGKVISGIASFYSKNLDGTLTATGERYRNKKYTAASNNLKLNTWVLVTNLKNQNSVIVRINDRMHVRMQKKGRVVDLSGIAAKELDFINDGLAKVKVEVLTILPLSYYNKSGSDSLQKDENTILETDSTQIKQLRVIEYSGSGLQRIQNSYWESLKYNIFQTNQFEDKIYPFSIATKLAMQMSLQDKK